MFTIDATITDLKSREKLLFKVLFSMNSHQVANPEMSLEEARSYVFFFRDGGKLEVYIGLYFIATDRRLFYTHSSNPFPHEALADIEGEARNFTEDLGAMLDEIDFARLSTAEREHWISEQEFLSGRKQEVSIPERSQQPQTDQQAPVQRVAAASPVPPVTATPQLVEVVLPAVVETAGLPDVKLPAKSNIVVAPAPGAAPAIPAAPVIQQSAEPAVSTAPQQDRPNAAAVQPQPKSQKSPARSGVKAEEAGVSAAKAPPAAKGSAEDVIDDAVRAGVVKAPKEQLKKEIRSASGSIGREKEALARLLASF